MFVSPPGRHQRRRERDDGGVQVGPEEGQAIGPKGVGEAIVIHVGRPSQGCADEMGAGDASPVRDQKKWDGGHGSLLKAPLAPPQELLNFLRYYSAACADICAHQAFA